MITPRRYGSYELVDLIGEGGMGSVWRARHVMLDRPAAVKLMRACQGIPSGELTRRFEREVRATAGLRCPHTIAIHDYGVTDDGTFFYEARAALRRDFVNSGIGFSELEHRTLLVDRARSRGEITAALAQIPGAPVPVVVTAPQALPPQALPPPQVRPPPSDDPYRPSLPVPAEIVTRDPPSGLRSLFRKKDSVTAVFSGVDMVGVYDMPERLTVRALFGGIVIDLRDAVLCPGVTEIRCRAAFGGIQIIVPPDIRVEARGTGLFGGFHQRGGTAGARADAPVIWITGVAVFGGVDVRTKERRNGRSTPGDDTGIKRRRLGS